MKIIIDIGHPAHVHIFRNFACIMKKNGNTVLFTCRDKECTLELLNYYRFRFISFGKPFKKGTGKLLGLIWFNIKMLKAILKFKPDITLGHSSIYAAQMSWLLHIPHISVEDTGNMEQIRLYYPFSKAVLTPDSFSKLLGKKQINYSGNHELAYLYPVRFESDPSILKQLKLKPGEHFVLLRFVAWNASHDTDHRGISSENKVKTVNAFSKYAKVFISSESTLSPELEAYHLPVPYESIHNVIAFASLVYGESATMASEAAVLGIPAIYLDSTGRCYTNEEEEKYGLVFNFNESEEDQIKSIEKGVNILTQSNIKEEWQRKRQKLLNDKIDVTAFLLWFIENWPESFRIMKDNPDYQLKFK